MKEIEGTSVIEGTTTKETHEARMAMIANDILKGYKRKQLIAKYEPIYGDVFNVDAMIRNAYGYLFNKSKATTEDIKKINIERLEKLIYECDIDDDRRNILKAIDLQNKTAGVYEQQITVKTDDTIRFDIGIDENKDKCETTQLAE